MRIASVNPATEEEIDSFPEDTDTEVEKKIALSLTAFKDWSARDISERCAFVRKAGEELTANVDEYAKIVTLEMGKPITQSRAEILKCASVCQFYAQSAEGFLSPGDIQTEAHKSYVRYDPVGPVLAIMPWNFPFWQVFRFAAPALAAGNTGLLKHASNVSLCSRAIERVFLRSGFPEGAFQSLIVSGSRMEKIIRHPSIRAVTLTGSESAGKSTASIAGSEIKKTVLELGGSDPFVVLRDANVEKAARSAARARIINSGQSCIAAKRFIVVRDAMREFTEFFLSEISRIRIGDPMDELVEIGPMARSDLRKELQTQVERSRKQGARLLCGGEIPIGRGFFYPPTVLCDVRPEMTAAIEETFGPAAPLLEAKDENDAIRIANDSRFGLGASLWTEDLEKGERLAGQLEAGCVFINEFVKSDPRMPFGGIKMSGYGRELGPEGIREFVNVKSVWIMR